MSVNIAKKYIDFSNDCLIKYMTLIGGTRVSKNDFRKILETYNGVRYYNYYPPISKNKNANLNFYLSEKVHEIYAEYSEKKIEELLQLIKFVLDLDFIHLDQIEGSVLSAGVLTNSHSKEFEKNLTNLLKENLKRKLNFLNAFSDNTFKLIYQRTNNPKVTLVDLNYEIKFPVLYSKSAIDKVYSSDLIAEQRLLIEYNLIAAKILKEIISNDFYSKYIVEFPYSIFDKKAKKTRLLNIIDSDAIREKLVIKMDSLQYEMNQDSVVEMIQKGYKMAIELSYNFDFNKSNLKRLEVFEYILVNNDDASKLEEYHNKIIIIRK